ncbi:MAG: hypothetical protein PHT12_06260 [Patescibacteria group bacterium]|nr:hypothetical protein [Patescibacteria group bacterium]
MIRTRTIKNASEFGPGQGQQTSAAELPSAEEAVREVWLYAVAFGFGLADVDETEIRLRQAGDDAKYTWNILEGPRHEMAPAVMFARMLLGRGSAVGEFCRLFPANA